MTLLYHVTIKQPFEYEAFVMADKDEMCAIERTIADFIVYKFEEVVSGMMVTSGTFITNLEGLESAIHEWQLENMSEEFGYLVLCPDGSTRKGSLRVYNRHGYNLDLSDYEDWVSDYIHDTEYWWPSETNDCAIYISSEGYDEAEIVNYGFPLDSSNTPRECIYRVDVYDPSVNNGHYLTYYVKTDELKKIGDAVPKSLTVDCSELYDIKFGTELIGIIDFKQAMLGAAKEKFLNKMMDTLNKAGKELNNPYGRTLKEFREYWKTTQYACYTVEFDLLFDTGCGHLARTQIFVAASLFSEGLNEYEKYYIKKTHVDHAAQKIKLTLEKPYPMNLMYTKDK